MTAESFRRDRILDAALREFSELGEAGARTAAIADAAGVNKQLIFYYFGSKAGLYDAVLGNFLPSPPPTSSTESSLGPVERLRAIARGFYDALNRRPEVAQLVVRALADPGAGRAALAGTLREIENRVASIVTEGQAHGYVRDDADPRTSATQILSLMLGYLVREGALRPAGPSLDERTRWVDETCDLMARALSW